MAETYTLIQTTTLASPSATINFNSIPQTYTDLRLEMVYKSTEASRYATINFNSDVGTNYNRVGWHANRTTNSPARTADNNFLYCSANSMSDSYFSTNKIDILGYTETTRFKSMFLQVAHTAGWFAEFWASTYMSQSAISSLAIGISGGSFATNSRFSLYGIKAA